jgi:hypothetical protein
MADMKLQRLDGAMQVTRYLAPSDPGKLHRAIFRKHQELRAVGDGLLNPPRQLLFEGGEGGYLFDRVLRGRDADDTSRHHSSRIQNCIGCSVSCG